MHVAWNRIPKNWVKTSLLIIVFLWIIFTCFVHHKNTKYHELYNGFDDEIVPSKIEYKAVKNFSENVKNNQINKTTLDDIFITVKTAKKFHISRLDVIIKTWFTKAKNQTWFISDEKDHQFENKTDGHLYDSNCHDQHWRSDLSCKMGLEYDLYIKSKKNWWCHFDDDNYVNIENLVEILQRYDHNDDVYLGKTSIKKPFPYFYKGEKIQFKFATGGAGLCISKTLAKKIAPWAENGKFEKTSTDLRLPDDCTLGFIISYHLNVSLSVSPLFHSHLEGLMTIDEKKLKSQISFSYFEFNLVGIDISNRPFTNTQDPTRFLSIHCILYPHTEFCVQQKRKKLISLS